MSTLVERAEALAVEVSCTDDTLSVVLSDGRTISAPLAWFPRLLDATAKQRAEWELIGNGIGIHWEAIDEDISVASLLQPQHFMGCLTSACSQRARSDVLTRVAVPGAADAQSVRYRTSTQGR
jgi:hypothetical protein